MLQNTKAILMQEIDKLPDNQLQEVLQFVRQMSMQGDSRLSNLQRGDRSTVQEELINQEDPLSQFIGAVSCGSLAKDTDDELYGI